MNKTVRFMLVDVLTKSDYDVIPFINRKQVKFKTRQTNQRAPPLDTVMYILGTTDAQIILFHHWWINPAVKADII